VGRKNLSHKGENFDNGAVLLMRPLARLKQYSRKEGEQGIYASEVNDNPNIDTGVEGVVLKVELYCMTVAEFYATA
jgi:hypothetical protein